MEFTSPDLFIDGNDILIMFFKLLNVEKNY